MMIIHKCGFAFGPFLCYYKYFPHLAEKSLDPRKASYLKPSEDVYSDKAKLFFFSAFQENFLQSISLTILETLT